MGSPENAGIDPLLDEDELEVASRYEVLEKIGEGTYGTVYKALCRQTGERVAIKKISWSESCDRQTDRQTGGQTGGRTDGQVSAHFFPQSSATASLKLDMMLKLVAMLVVVVVVVGVHGASHVHHTTPAPLPDAVRLQKLEQVTEQLSRQLMLQQLYIEEKTRSEYDSGLKQLRVRKIGMKSYHADSYAGHSIAAIHDHSNLERTPGMGEMVVVLNGLEFRTRHNDYKVKMPVHNKTYHAVEDIPFPPIPPSVKHQSTVEKQSAEMREYFKAWRDGNTTHRDYRPYFKPVMCYLEGAWTLDKHLEEPFVSDRHNIEADSWFDLQEKIRYTSATGDRLNSQNFAYLPTTIYNVSDGVPSFSQWNYRILCHPLQGEVKPSVFTPVDDLAHRMSYKYDYERYQHNRMVRFAVDDKPNGRESHFFQTNLLDDWMYQIPGKDNYGSHMTDSTFDNPKQRVDNEQLLNVANYHRTWKSGAKDAMGDTVGHRGFADKNMYIAETTQPRVAPIHVKSCARHHCNEVTKRLSYAIPLEVIFLTPLNTWNPYNLENHGKFQAPSAHSVMADGRNGGTTLALAYNGTHSKAYYYTPVEFFSGAEVSHDPADTTKAATGVLDRQGKMRLMKSSGIRITLPNIEGVGSLRLRYPIMPLAVEGSPIWKETEAMRDLVMDMDANSNMMVKAPEGLKTFSASPSHHG